MSEILIGVVVGGVIASVSPLLTLWIHHRRWRVQVRLEHIRAKREKLEGAFQRSLHEIRKGMKNNIYSSDMLSDVDYLFPSNVSQAVEELMAEEDKSVFNMKRHYYLIARAMKASLAELDDQIEEIIS